MDSTKIVADDVERPYNKRPRTQAKNKLVVSLNHLLGENLDKSLYSFTFFSIRGHVDNPLLELENTLTWPTTDKGLEETNMFISFLHSSTCPSSLNKNDGSGVVYAVGGLPSVDYKNLDSDQIVPPSLPDVLTCIPLSGNTLLDDNKTQMIAGKLFPLIEEINGLIYVLSGPAICFGPPHETRKDSFEVYNPRDNTRKILMDAPFNHSRSRPSTFSSFVYARELQHLVLDHKLYVSDGLYSCVYDTKTDTWSACHLFSDYYSSGKLSHPIRYEEYQRDDCGLAFPFNSKALLWKDQIFVCLIPGENPPIAAFRITDDEKAVFLQLSYEGTAFPYGMLHTLVDLGGDNFGLTLIQDKDEEDEVANNSVTIFTFRLKIDATSENRIIAKGLKEFYFKPERDDYFNTYSFAY